MSKQNKMKQTIKRNDATPKLCEFCEFFLFCFYLWSKSMTNCSKWAIRFMVLCYSYSHATHTRHGVLVQIQCRFDFVFFFSIFFCRLPLNCPKSRAIPNLLIYIFLLFISQNYFMFCYKFVVAFFSLFFHEIQPSNDIQQKRSQPNRTKSTKRSAWNCENDAEAKPKKRKINKWTVKWMNRKRMELVAFVYRWQQFIESSNAEKMSMTNSADKIKLKRDLCS